MTEVERIADQFRRAFEGEAWHGPSLRELLHNVTADQAVKRPVAGAHSIWEIVLHMQAWHRAVDRRLRGEIINLSEQEAWPDPHAGSETAWRQTVQEFFESYRTLLTTLSRLNDSKLDETTPGKTYSNYVLLHGVIQHDLYHAGQIALLKKLP